MRKLCCFVLLLCASPLAAQTSAAPPAKDAARTSGTVAEPTPRTIAERIAPPASAAVLFAPAETAEPLELPAMRRVSGRGTALAIVGGALFSGGLVAGGDAGAIMVIAGAGIGAYGLYLMLTV